jgi:hypothetical protein
MRWENNRRSSNIEDRRGESQILEEVQEEVLLFHYYL